MKTFDKFGFGQKMVCLALLVAVGTTANYVVHLQSKVDNLTGLLQLAEMRSDVNTEWANEVTWGAIHSGTKEMIKGQGRIEGIVSVVSPVESEKNDYYSTVWHDGYERGLNQNEDMIETQSIISYTKGFKEAMQKQGKSLDDAEVIPPSKPINSSAIKTPDFDDQAGQLLEANEELRKTLNNTFKQRLQTEDNDQKIETKD